MEELGVRAFAFRVAAQTEKLNARRNERLAAEAAVEIARDTYDGASRRLAFWRSLNPEHGLDAQVALQSARQELLEYANRRYAQVWRLVDTYLFDPSERATGISVVQPRFDVPTLNELRTRKALLDAAVANWESELPQEFRLASTFPPADLVRLLPPNSRVADRIRPYAAEHGFSPQPAPRLRGTEDLNRLLNGFTFQIRPRTPRKNGTLSWRLHPPACSPPGSM